MRDAPEGTTPGAAPRGRGPLHNVGWMLGSLFSGTMWTNQVLLNVVIPLWLVQATDAPHWLLAWLFGTNTVLCIFLPSLHLARGRTLSDALRSVRISGAFFVLACLITMATHSTAGFLTIFLVWLGHVAVTGAELYISGRLLGVPGQADGPRAAAASTAAWPRCSARSAAAGRPRSSPCWRCRGTRRLCPAPAGW